MTVPSVELSKPKTAGAKPLSGPQSLVPWRKTDVKEADTKQELGKYQRQLQVNFTDENIQQITRPCIDPLGTMGVCLCCKCIYFCD